MNVDLIKQKLAALKSQGGGSKSIWKPKPGKAVIRLLPYLHDPEWPFTELSFHYDLTGGTVLSPEVFGKPDPINDFADKLRQTGEKEDFLLSRKIHSKERWFAPVLVRGEETEGVKFWGMSKTIYEALLAFMDEGYGDLTDPQAGRDLTVTYTAAESSEGYPDITVMPKPNISVVTTSKEVLDLIKEMPDVKTLFKTMEYKELEMKLKKFIDGVSGESKDEVLPDDDDEVETVSPEPKPKAFSKAEVKSEPKTEDKPVATSISDISDAFDSLFK